MRRKKTSWMRKKWTRRMSETLNDEACQRPSAGHEGMPPARVATVGEERHRLAAFSVAKTRAP